MLAQLALGKCTNDLIIDPAGGIFRVCDGRFVIQQVQSKLNTVLGEWVLDRRIGFINQEDFEKNFDLFSIESRMVEIILGTKGVLSVEDIDTSFKNRVLTLNFKARTIYGLIDTEVPWDCLSEEDEGSIPQVSKDVIFNGVQVTFGGERVIKIN